MTQCQEKTLCAEFGAEMRKVLPYILLQVFMVSCVKLTPEVRTSTTPVPSPTHTQTVMPEPTFTRTVTPSPSPEPQCNSHKGHIEETSYPGVVVEGDVPVRLYLPPCYEFSTSHYPVLYVLHGYPLDEMHWEDLGIIQTVEEGFLEGTWEPFLVVMPRIPDPLNTKTDGGPGSYEEEMLSGLIPYVEGHYRTIGSKTSHALAGVSRGGVWALEIGFRNADWFDIVAALSPALHVNQPRPAYDPFNLVRSETELPSHIFLSAAESEAGFRIKTEELSQLLDTRGIQHSYLLTPGVHEDATWQAIMQDLILFITSAWELLS
jgi:enterochelin esterase-like enzyme